MGEVLGVDWWLDPVVTEHFPADVDFEGGVRRVWPDHRPQEVFLMANGHQPWLQASIERCQFASILTLFSLIAALCENQQCCCFGHASLLQSLAMSKGYQIPCSRLSLGESFFADCAVECEPLPKGDRRQHQYRQTKKK